MGQAFFLLVNYRFRHDCLRCIHKQEENLISGARNTAFFDTLAALVATLVVIPACFAYGVDVNGGMGLLFVTLPNILQDMYGGQIIAIVLFLSVCFEYYLFTKYV